jgi:NitT/TauT family transport system permease protein
VLGVVLVLALFEVLGRAGIVARSYLPPSSQVLARAAVLAGRTGFLGAVGTTLGAWLAALACGVAAGAVLGALLGAVPAVRAAVGALVEFLRPIPSVALIPLAALLLGSGLGLTTALGGYAAVWPVLFNTLYGIAGTDPVAADTLRAFGFGRWQVLWRVSVPGAAPFAATGVRLASSIVLIVVVGTEILSGRPDGIGGYAAAAETGTGGTVTVLACAVWAGLLGLLIDTALVRGRARAFAWAVRERPG